MIDERIPMPVSEKAFGLEDVCTNLAKIAENLGDETAFSLIQRDWPTVSRALLRAMLSYSEEPNPGLLEKLKVEFQAAMSCS